MHDSLVVRCCQSARHFHCVLDSLPLTEWTPAQTVAERLSFEQFRHYVGRALGGSNVIDGDDVGVIEGGGRARFLLEATQAIGIVGIGSGQDFDGYVAPEPGIASTVHLAHAAGA